MALPDIFWFDCETSGLDPKKDQILQFACILTNPLLEEIRRDSFFLKYEGDPEDWSAEAERVHGLSLEFLEKEGLEVNEARSRIIDFLNQSGFPPKPGGHNVAFDIQFLRSLIPRDLYRNLLDYHYTDTMIAADLTNQVAMSSGYKPPFTSLKLTGLCEALNVPILKAHDALSDIEATIQIWKKLSKLLQIRKK